MTCEEKDASKFRNFNPAGPADQHALDATDFRTKMQEVLPCAGFHKLFEQPPITDEIKLKCCIPEPQFQYNSKMDLKTKECQEEFQKFELNLKFDPSEIEELTRGQNSNKLWVSARKGRITASNFGKIIKNQGLKTKSVTKTVMGYYASPVSNALDWGRKHEKTALSEYKKVMKSKGCKVSVEQSGLVIHKKYVFLGASPDGVVNCNGENGLLEVKCPFSYRCSTPVEATENKDFCCDLVNNELKLKDKHSYYYQVQGQMALTGYEWCDFVVWTLRGISVQRIHFDKTLWEMMCTKLISFYRNVIIPEIYTSKIRRDI